MVCVAHKAAKATNQIYTHVTASMHQIAVNALDTVALNLKQKILPHRQKRAHHTG